MTGENANNGHIEKLRSKVYALTDIDISNFRGEFVNRCLSNRICRTGAASVEEYLELIDEAAEELLSFCDALSVYHSWFVRDPVKYQIIKEIILPELTKAGSRRPGSALAQGAKTQKRALKVWCAGCAAGEEPYSIAIVISDALGSELANWNISITASDINTGLLEKARKGVYSRAELVKNCFPPIFIKQYFDEADDGRISIKEHIRRMIRFEKADLAAGSPRMGMDMIMCRNVLIYIDKKAVNRIINGFYESLNGNGYLILGNSEMLEDSFSCKFKKIKAKNEFFYRKIIEGSLEHIGEVEKRKNIIAALGIQNGNK